MTLVEIESICPSCGRWKVLEEVTGFCRECSPGLLPLCIICNNPFTPDHKYRTTCQRCKREAWLRTHANRLESLLAQGLTFDQAEVLVRRDWTPRCSSCGDPIKGGRRGYNETLFCTNHPECKTAKRRYRWLRDTRYPANKFLAFVHVRIELQMKGINDVTRIGGRETCTY